jgi:Na+-driven multidrug efflux pump
MPGAGATRNLRQAAVAALGLSAAMVAVTIALLIGFREDLVGLFVGPDDPLRPLIVLLGAQLLSWRRSFSWPMRRRSWRWACCAACRTRAFR